MKVVKDSRVKFVNAAEGNQTKSYLVSKISRDYVTVSYRGKEFALKREEFFELHPVKG